MIRIRQMTAADLGLGMRLKTQAGWNQTEADWRRFLEMQPDGCFVAEFNGVAIGTAVGCMFGSVAWIAMVLVDAEFRGRGIGTALMQHALAFVDGTGAASVRLDATPLGLPLYEKLGFIPQYELTRYDGQLTAAKPLLQLRHVRTAQQNDYESILELDRELTHTDRRKFLFRLFGERPDEVRVIVRGGRIDGYATLRAGSDAIQIGPCVAATDAGEWLLADACRRLVGHRVFLDMPCSNDAAVRFAESIGLVSQRRLTRMCRGVQVNDDCARLWASSGPEVG